MSRWTVHAVDAESASARIPAWRGTHRLSYAVSSLVAKDLWRRPVRATRAETVARTGRQARSSARLADVSPLTRLVNRMQIRTRVTDRAGNEGSSDSGTLTSNGAGAFWVSGSHPYANESPVGTPYVLTVTVSPTNSPASGAELQWRRGQLQRCQPGSTAERLQH